MPPFVSLASQSFEFSSLKIYSSLFRHNIKLHFILSGALAIPFVSLSQQIFCPFYKIEEICRKSQSPFHVSTPCDEHAWQGCFAFQWSKCCEFFEWLMQVNLEEKWPLEWPPAVASQSPNVLQGLQPGPPLQRLQPISQREGTTPITRPRQPTLSVEGT